MDSTLQSKDAFFSGLGTRLHYIELGPPQGTPVVLLPGWPQTAYTWRHVAPLLGAGSIARCLLICQVRAQATYCLKERLTKCDGWRRFCMRLCNPSV